MRRLTPLAAIAVLALFCLGGSAMSATSNVSVGATGLSYGPSTITIAPGDTVHWAWSGSIQHTVTADDMSFDSLSGTGTAGKTYDRTFNTPGTYLYHCTFHGASGMTGTVIVKKATIAGTVYDDSDGDGVHDAGEPPLQGVTINMTPSGGSAVHATTAANGNYEFADLDAGDYTVDYDQPANTTNTGTASYPVTLVAGQQATGKNFLAARNDGQLTGKVWHDLNGNAAGDPGEPGLAGVNMSITRDGDATPVADPTTAVDGTWGSTPVLLPGGYTVTYDAATLPAGYAATGPTSRHVVLSGGATVSAQDLFAADQQATISGSVATPGPGGAGRPGVKVFLDKNADGLFTGGEPSSTTDNAGAYSFTGLLPGSYKVNYELPAGFDAVTGRPIVVQLGDGFDAVDQNFTIATGSATISGIVHDDVDGSASQSPGEGTVANVTIGLDTSGDGVADQTTTTASDGSYGFGGLTAHAYRVLIVVPGGYENTGPAAFDATLARGGNASNADFFIRRPPPGPGTQPPAEQESPTESPEPSVELLGQGNGTPGDDLLNGTGKADKIFGLGGNDLLLGLGGNDLLDGGDGNDNMDGGAGNDTLKGGNGNDSLTGGTGDDKLFGGPGKDKLSGGKGNDSLNGGPGKDTLNGGPGNDTINSKDGVAETVNCGAGKDKVKADKKDKLKACEKRT